MVVKNLGDSGRAVEHRNYGTMERHSSFAEVLGTAGECILIRRLLNKRLERERRGRFLIYQQPSCNTVLVGKGKSTGTKYPAVQAPVSRDVSLSHCRMGFCVPSVARVHFMVGLVDYCICIEAYVLCFRLDVCKPQAGLIIMLTVW